MCYFQKLRNTRSGKNNFFSKKQYLKNLPLVLIKYSLINKFMIQTFKPSITTRPTHEDRPIDVIGQSNLNMLEHFWKSLENLTPCKDHLPFFP